MRYRGVPKPGGGPRSRPQRRFRHGGGGTDDGGRAARPLRRRHLCLVVSPPDTDGKGLAPRVAEPRLALGGDPWDGRGSEAASVRTLTHRVVIPPSGAPSCPAIYYQDILGVLLDHGEIKPPYQDICHVDCRLKQSSHIGRGKMRRPSRAWHAHWAHAWKTSWSLVF